MKNNELHLEMPSIALASTKFDNEDKVLQCNAFLSTKLFMAKRIAEQQKEIETLKEQLCYHTTRHTELYDIMRQINEQLEFCKSKLPKRVENPDLEKLNISGDLAHSFTLEGGDEEIKEKPASTKEKMIYEDESEKIISCLKNENLTLRLELEAQKTENLNKNFFNNKIVYEKFIVLTELNELIQCLKRVDLNLLNKFYLEQNEKVDQFADIFDLSRSNLNFAESFNSISAMGIKYNILSAHSQTTLLMNTLQKEGEFMSHSAENQALNVNGTKNNFSFNENLKKNCFLLENFEKSVGVISEYEDELNSYVYDIKNVKMSSNVLKKRSESCKI